MKRTLIACAMSTIAAFAGSAAEAAPIRVSPLLGDCGVDRYPVYNYRYGGCDFGVCPLDDWRYRGLRGRMVAPRRFMPRSRVIPLPGRRLGGPFNDGRFDHRFDHRFDRRFDHRFDRRFDDPFGRRVVPRGIAPLPGRIPRRVPGGPVIPRFPRP